MRNSKIAKVVAKVALYQHAASCGVSVETLEDNLDAMEEYATDLDPMDLEMGDYPLEGMEEDMMDQEARFEKGKPADPTKNMSPEDAEEWEEMKEKHKDKFKKGENESLREAAIRIAYENPALRADILGLLQTD